MKSKKIIGLGAVLCAAGVILTGAGLAMGGKLGIYMDRNGIHSMSEAVEEEKEPYVMKKTKLEELHDLSLKTDFAEICLIPSDDFYLEYRVKGNSKEPTVKTENGKLVFEENLYSGNMGDAKVYFFSVNIPAFQGEKTMDYYVKLYYPEDTVFNTVELESEDENIEAGNLTADTLKIHNAYGDTEVRNLKGNQLDVTVNDGDFTADDIKAEKFSVTNAYGDVKLGDFNGGSGEITLNDGKFKINTLEAKKLTLRNSYGDIEAAEISGGSGEITLNDGDFEADAVNLETLELENAYGAVKIGTLGGTEGVITLKDGSFTADAISMKKVELSDDSGDIRIGEYSGQDGRIELRDGTLEVKNAEFEDLQIRNSYGDVRLSVPQWEDYTMDLETKYGEIILPHNKTISDDEDNSYDQQGDIGKQLEVSCNDGNIEIIEF